MTKSSIREISLSGYLEQRKSLESSYQSLFDFYYLTGTRTSEALMVKGIDVDLDKRNVFVHTEKNKQNPYRKVGFYNYDGKAEELVISVQDCVKNRDLGELLWTFPGFKRPRDRVWKMCWETFACTTHSFRHTHAIMLVRDLGFSMNELMAEMGWSSMDSTSHYVQYETEASRRKKMGLETKPSF